jgi:HK97 family phage prohead protease
MRRPYHPSQLFHATGGRVSLARGSATADGFKVRGLAVPFNVVTGDERRRVFAPGSFKKTIEERGERGAVKLLYQHDPDQVLGTVTSAKVTARGVEVEASIADTTQGRDVVKLIKAGALDAFSVGVDVIREARIKSPEDLVKAGIKDPTLAMALMDGGPFDLATEARWWETSVVTFPAFDSARMGPNAEHRVMLKLGEMLERLEQLEARTR